MIAGGVFLQIRYGGYEGATTGKRSRAESSTKFFEKNDSACSAEPQLLGGDSATGQQPTGRYLAGRQPTGLLFSGPDAVAGARFRAGVLQHRRDPGKLTCAVNSCKSGKNKEGDRVFCGGEFVFSKFIRDGFSPPPSISSSEI